MGPTRFRDRASGRLETERVFQLDTLRFLYQRPLGRILERYLVSRPLFSHLYTWRRRRPQSAARIAAFADEAGIDLTEIERPLSEYRSLDDFFTRRLRPGARALELAPDRLVSPADARLLVAPELEGAELPVKGTRVSLPQLLDDEALARRYRGGCALIFRLAVADYHRFHFPDGGVASATRAILGPLHSVHPIALAAGAASFANKRAVTLLESDNFGTVTMVEVGAASVGTIEQIYRPGRVERGAEKGTFHFGGSTIVLLLEPGRLVIDADLLEFSTLNRPDAVETRVRMGTAIGRRP
jgi:phosphatidylserine decarboxylase